MEQHEFLSVWNRIDKDGYCGLLQVDCFPISALYEHFYMLVLACPWCFLLKVFTIQQLKNMHVQFLSSSFPVS